nr:MAG TPA: hypothetical protein [Caudoviricetes sp.]
MFSNLNSNSQYLKPSFGCTNWLSLVYSPEETNVIFKSFVSATSPTLNTLSTLSSSTSVS